jgi:hypothetical protein
MKMMNYDIDLDGHDFGDELVRQIEKDYGRTIVRIPYFEHADEPNTFDIKVIFSDFKLLEGQIRVVPLFDFATIRVSGTYY